MHPAQAPLHYIVIIAVLFVCSILLYWLVSLFRLQAKYRLRCEQECGLEISQLEADRKIFSASLHDEIAPLLLVTKMHLWNIRMPGRDVDLEIQSALECLEKMYGRMRTCIDVVSLPRILFDRGPVEAVEAFIDTYPLEKKQQLFISGYLPRLTERAAVHIYRIMQDFIINACKHSNACRLEMIASVEKKQLVLSATYDDPGYPTGTSVLPTEDDGLLYIKKRVQALNGTLHEDGSENKGSRYCIMIPLAGICKNATGNE